MNQLETLLQRYREGVITPDEQAELDQLTNRHRVLTDATNRAAVLRRRRRSTISAVASLMIVAGIAYTLWLTTDGGLDNRSMVAQYNAGQPPVVSINDAVHQNQVQQSEPALQPTRIDSIASSQAIIQPPIDPPKSDKTITTTRTVPSPEVLNTDAMAPAPIPASETVVACNTQCSPDSVINDIWNFLKA